MYRTKILRKRDTERKQQIKSRVKQTAGERKKGKTGNEGLRQKIWTLRQKKKEWESRHRQRLKQRASESEMERQTEGKTESQR